MPVFTYRGTNRAGATVTGERAAASKSELASMLRRESINVSKLSEKGKEFNIPTFGTGVEAKELAVFTRQFSVMIDAGLAPRAVPGDSRGPAGEQDLPEDPDRRARIGRGRRDAVHLDEAVREGFRPALLQHGGSRRDGRYSRHHSPALVELHRKERQAEAGREVGYDLPRFGSRHRGGGDHPAALEGRPDFRHPVQRVGCRPALADAHRNRAQQFRWKHLRVDDFCLCHRRRNCDEVLVRHSARPDDD